MSFEPANMTPKGNIMATSSLLYLLYGCLYGDTKTIVIMTVAQVTMNTRPKLPLRVMLMKRNAASIYDSQR